MTPQRYLSVYLEPFPSEPRVAEASRLPQLDSHHFYTDDELAAGPERPGKRSMLPLERLFVAGVECGHNEAREELKRRVVEVDAQFAEARAVRDRIANAREELGVQLVAAYRKIDEFDDERAKTQAHVGHMEVSVIVARQRINELETSRIWRVTAPLRTGGHRAKVAVARVRARLRDFRRVPQQAGIALEVLRGEGGKALFERVKRRLLRHRRFVPPAGSVFEPATLIAALAFVSSAEPRVSIVVPVYGQALATYTCLQSVHQHTTGASYEILVVDDASPEPTADALGAVTGARFLRNEVNLGFVKTCNRGAGEARGEFVLFLNNDTIVTEGWLEALLAVFSARPDAGLVGAKLIYPDRRLQEAGGIIWRDGSAWNYGRDDDPDKPRYNYLREVDYCSGACIMIPRQLFGELGGFDERFAPAYYEDADLAFAVRAAGRKVFYQPACTVVHFEGISSGTDETAGVKRFQTINRGIFTDKWEAVLATHRAHGEAPDLECDRSAQRRVLVIDACMLTPDQDAGSLRMQQLMHLLISLGCKLTFVADNLEYREPYVGSLQQMGVEVLFHPYERSISNILGKRGREFDIVIMSRHYIAIKHIDAVRTFAPQALAVFDTVDLHFLREERLAELHSSRVARETAQVKRAEELALMRKADLTLVVSHVEEALLLGLAPDARVSVLSTIHEPVAGTPPFENREGIVFIGSFLHPPNVDAVLHYAKAILPRIRERLPGVKTYVIGANPPPSVRAEAADDFVVTDFVPDIAPYFIGCRVSVSPLRYGAGVKGKINLAMSYGLPVVATSPSIEGMFLTPEADVLVADDPAAFADAVARIYTDAALWNTLAEAGRENIRQHFSRDVARSAITRLLALADTK